MVPARMEPTHDSRGQHGLLAEHVSPTPLHLAQRWVPCWRWQLEPGQQRNLAGSQVRPRALQLDSASSGLTQIVPHLVRGSDTHLVVKSQIVPAQQGADVVPGLTLHSCSLGRQQSQLQPPT